MTEIPEHLLKRAKEAREKAAAEEALPPRPQTHRQLTRRRPPAATRPLPIRGSLPTCSSAAGRRGRRRPTTQSEVLAARVAVADKVGAVVAAAPAGGGVPLGAGPGGHTQRLLTVVKSGSIQEVKAAPIDKVHTWPHLLAAEFAAALAVHGVHVPVLGVGQRPAAADSPTPTRRRTRRRRRGTSSACRNCSRCSTR